MKEMFFLPHHNFLLVCCRRYAEVCGRLLLIPKILQLESWSNLRWYFCACGHILAFCAMFHTHRCVLFFCQPACAMQFSLVLLVCTPLTNLSHPLMSTSILFLARLLEHAHTHTHKLPLRPSSGRSVCVSVASGKCDDRHVLLPRIGRQTCKETDTRVQTNRIMTGQLGTCLICLDVSSHLRPSSSHYSGLDTHTTWSTQTHVYNATRWNTR